MRLGLPPPKRWAHEAYPVTAGRQIHWLAVDWLAAATLLVLLAEHAAGRQPQFGVPPWLAVLASAAAALPIALRRVEPVAVFVIVLSANTLATVSGVSGNPAVAVAIALYTVAVALPPRRSGPALAAALGLTLGAQAFPGLEGQPPLPRPAFEYLTTATSVIIMAAWVIGVMQRRYVAHTAREIIRQAVTDERLSVARELHDVISHALTLITAKAAVTNYLPESRPEDTREALALIEATGRAALAEMRRLLGVLRADGDGTPVRGGDRPDPGDAQEESTPGSPGTGRAPAPGLTGLEGLAARATAAGIRTRLDICGERDLPEAMALSVYRIVQEALTNVIKHAGPARCDIRVDLNEDHVAVDITDDGSARPAAAGRPRGHGLIGMRERVSLYGGEFTAGARPEGGFRVTVRLPASPA